MKKAINIFLASSINELRVERLEIENFIHNISDDFEKHYDVKVMLLHCGKLDDAVELCRKQEIINNIIRECDICFFIFFSKAGQYTREEFDVAFSCFKQIGKPKIYTYFKELENNKADKSLIDFRTELEKSVQHYYGTFEHIDTVKLRILLALKFCEMDYLEVQLKGDACYINGLKVLSVENVSEFANNRKIKELTEEFEKTDNIYSALKDENRADWSDSKICEYAEIVNERQRLMDSLMEQRRNILSMSMNMCRDEASGIISKNQRDAYRLFEAGDLEGANRLLDFSEMKNECIRDVSVLKAGIAVIEENIKKRYQVFIREGRTKIGILAIMTDNIKKYEEIDNIYNDITEKAFEEKIETDIIIDYVWFLFSQGNCEKAYEIAKRIEAEFFCLADEKTCARLYHVLGFICSDNPLKKEEAEEYYIKAIRIREKLVKENPEAYEFLLSRSYHNLADFYADKKEIYNANWYYHKAMNIRKRLVTSISENNAFVHNGNCNVAEACYSEKEEFEKEEKRLHRKLNVLKKLVALFPKKYAPTLAECYNSICTLYLSYYMSGNMDFEKYSEFDDLFMGACDLYDSITDQNPEYQDSRFVSNYVNYAVYAHNSMVFEVALNLAKRHPEDYSCRKLLFERAKRSVGSQFEDYRDILIDFAKQHPEIPDCKEILFVLNGEL